ncbi:MAG: hypothetical protein HUJ68_07300 [Clostridia bacterium]|nr:hypothetical protein [Clostridia bacterium]
MAPFITSCSCAADQQTINLINRINTAFNNTDPAILSATSVADATVAETEYGNNVLNNTESKQNEILFACFNFVVAKGLTINGFNCTPSGKSFYDLFNDGCIQMNSAYNMNVEAIENNRFEFQLQG